MEKMKRMVSIISLIFILLPATLAFAEEPKAPVPAGQEAPAAAAPAPAPAPAVPACVPPQAAER